MQRNLRPCITSPGEVNAEAVSGSVRRDQRLRGWKLCLFHRRGSLVLRFRFFLTRVFFTLGCWGPEQR